MPTINMPICENIEYINTYDLYISAIVRGGEKMSFF